jgi:hypothetical protein
VSRWRVERFDGVAGSWYVTDGQSESRTFLFKLHAQVVAWWRNLHA